MWSPVLIEPTTGAVIEPDDAPITGAVTETDDVTEVGYYIRFSWL